MLKFHIEHVFNCSSLEHFWAAYFSPERVEISDKALHVRDTKILEEEDSEQTLRRVIRKVPDRQLPGFLKKFAKGELSFTQEQIFYKADNRIHITVFPSIFEGKSKIEGDYSAGMVGPNQIKRTYQGTIEFKVKLIGGRIEKSVREDMLKSMDKGAEVTQKWLDEHFPVP